MTSLYQEIVENSQSTLYNAYQQNKHRSRLIEYFDYLVDTTGLSELYKKIEITNTRNNRLYENLPLRQMDIQGVINMQDYCSSRLHRVASEVYANWMTECPSYHEEIKYEFFWKQVTALYQYLDGNDMGKLYDFIQQRLTPLLDIDETHKFEVESGSMKLTIKKRYMHLIDETSPMTQIIQLNIIE